MSHRSVTYLKDYTPPHFLVDHIELDILLRPHDSTVSARMTLRRNPQIASDLHPPLVLDGQAMQLTDIQLNEKSLNAHDYQVNDDALTIFKVPKEPFVLTTEVIIHPADNKALSGLYISKGNFCTQCESQGFRAITYFLDRPDVLTRFTTTLHADQSRYPVLLSNGNLISQGDEPDGYHYATWEDPSLKPCYLFALVAGDYEYTEDTFVTCSGRAVTLRIYVEQGKRSQAWYALDALKQAMAWDERVYGRVYDLNIYMIVAVSDFNFGAMENKGLNIFNSCYILAQPELATDCDYMAISQVVAHEYFHNWSGNRVTLRDWFQISLKEGLTVFRDQSFMEDTMLKSVKRIEEVKRLRSTQFVEDAGPIAHPVRPDAYLEIGNFYTATVYNKGAEVIRMMHTLLGPELFRQAMDTYFDRFDGQAVTTDDFVDVMAETSGINLTGVFKRWYTQAGTPVVQIKTLYDAERSEYILDVTQSCPPTPGQHHKQPMFIPLAIGLLDPQSGQDLLLHNPQHVSDTPTTTCVLHLKKPHEQFRFSGITQEPIPSMLRHFSAPVYVQYDDTTEQLIFLLKHDSDDFNRWQAGQRLVSQAVFRYMDRTTSDPYTLQESLVIAFNQVMVDKALSPALIAEILQFPSFDELVQARQPNAEVELICQARRSVQKRLAQRLHHTLLSIYKQLNEQQRRPYQLTEQDVAQRSLKNVCLSYLMRLEDDAVRALCLQQFKQADNMTDRMAALQALNDSQSEDREHAMSAFYQQWQSEEGVIDKWFALQARAHLPDTPERIITLLKHPDFTLNNPNRARALIGVFSRCNPWHFHRADGWGYAFLKEQVLAIDAFNPLLAARLLTPLTQWELFDQKRQKLMKNTLSDMLKHRLSNHLYEIVYKSCPSDSS